MAGPPDAYRERLISRRPFVSAAQRLLHDLSKLDISAAQWTDYKMENAVLDKHIWSPYHHSQDYHQEDRNGPTQIICVRLNRLRTGVGRFQSSMHKWGLAPTSNCECGAAVQTAGHIILTCPTHRAPTGIHGLTVLDDDKRCWLNAITASIWTGQRDGASCFSTFLWVDAFPKERKKKPSIT